jgi:aminoglycoside phosphotransferase family enzyme
MEQDHTADQAETIAFLMRPESYGQGVVEVERIDTHGAMVFLAGDRAYKLKRAVKLPYLDFSTPDKRRAVSERELAINRRTAPNLYLDVIAIRRDGEGRLHLGGEGEAVDWVIAMRRFPEDAVLDWPSVTGKLDPALMPRLASRVRRFHQDAAQAKDAPWLPNLAHIIDTLEEALLGADARALALPAAPYLARLRQELRERAPLLRERQAEGYVRRCHGDLHLKNIVLLDDEPILFDALEFDENLATIDVLYDLAFLLMDLWHRGARDEANLVVSSYFEGDRQIGEWAGLALLRLFLSLRAAIRAMVGVHSLSVVSQDDRRNAEQAIRDYLALAIELLTHQPPLLVCIGGLSGTGKTTIARALAPTIGAVPGAIHLRSDIERKRMFGVEPLSTLPATAYSNEVSDKLYRRLFDEAAAILRTGHSVILDASFREPAQRDAAAKLAQQERVAFRA